MSKQVFISLVLSALLTACGGGDKNNETNAYGYGQNAQQGGFCSRQVANDWRNLIATNCEHVQGEQQACACVRGAEFFRQKNPGVSCKLLTRDGRWFPGHHHHNGHNGGNQNQGVLINDAILSGIFQQHGWAASQPGCFGGPGHGPGFPR